MNTFSKIAVNCSEPPERPGSGTWAWNLEYKYRTEITYTCGPFGNFKGEDGERYTELTSYCAWNKTWTPSELDPCVAASCQVIPFPDPGTGLVYQPEEGSSLSLQSEFTVYNPRIKPTFQMNFPGPDFCKGNGDIMLIVGTYPMVKGFLKLTISIFPILRKRRSHSKSSLLLMDLMRLFMQALT